MKEISRESSFINKIIHSLHFALNNPLAFFICPEAYLVVNSFQIEPKYRNWKKLKPKLKPTKNQKGFKNTKIKILVLCLGWAKNQPIHTLSMKNWWVWVENCDLDIKSESESEISELKKNYIWIRMIFRIRNFEHIRFRFFCTPLETMLRFQREHSTIHVYRHVI